MAAENDLWGAERIRGELLKLGIEVSKRTIQKYMPKDRKSHVSSQTWATFLKNQAGVIWACDFTMMHDWLFRSWYIFVVLDLKTRRIVHASVTQYPTDEWTAQQLREATPWGRGPKYLIRDRDSKYAAHFSLWQPVLGSRNSRRRIACHKPMGCVKGSWAVCQERPHQGIGQRIPEQYALSKSKPASGRIVTRAILGGLHHSYARATNLN